MKIFFIVSIFIIGFKFMLWCSPYLMPKTLNQPYSVQERLYSSYANYWKGEVEHRRFELRYNSKGNPMRAKRGESKKCLFVGGSTYFSKRVNQEKSFISQLDKKLEDIYIEPYIHEGLRDGQAAYLLKSLVEQKKSYDCVLIGVHPSGEIETGPRNTFVYWSQWLEYNERPFHYLIIKAQEAIQKSKYYNLFTESPDRRPLAEKEFEWRWENEHLIRYYPTQPSKEYTKMKSDRMKRVFEVALELSDNVYYINQPIAYDENEHEDVHKRWPDKYINFLPNGEKVYFNNKAVAEERRYFNDLANQQASKLGINIIYLDDFLRSKIQKTPDIFEDKWHFSVQGSDLASRFVSDRVYFP